MEENRSWLKTTALVLASAAIALLGAYQLYTFKKKQREKTGISKKEYIEKLVSDLRTDYLIETLKKQKNKEKELKKSPKASSDWEKFKSLINKLTPGSSKAQSK
ncbi:MAG: hypothetical protein D6780_06735 [Candidatus Dadabacteria bacterium]|nr:MAG: hypothetical protein D6780_06735 [Candidatus Dadabacteria bacterium]